MPRAHEWQVFTYLLIRLIDYNRLFASIRPNRFLKQSKLAALVEMFSVTLAVYRDHGRPIHFLWGMDVPG